MLKFTIPVILKLYKVWAKDIMRTPICYWWPCKRKICIRGRGLWYVNARFADLKTNKDRKLHKTKKDKKRSTLQLYIINTKKTHHLQIVLIISTSCKLHNQTI
jgi:hypothetical protein